MFIRVPATPSAEIVMADVPSQEVSAFTQMRVARKETKVAGYRVSVANREEK